MVTADALTEMSEEQILDFASACARTAQRAEVDILRAAYQWAVVHPGIALDRELRADDHATSPGQDALPRWGGRTALPGIYVWRDPHGGFYLVDHTGTRLIPATGTGRDGTRGPLVVELWHPPAGIGIDIADDFARRAA